MIGKKLWLIGGIICLSLTVRAGDKVGNGGKIIVCPTAPKFELVDFYEARVLHGWMMKTGSSTQDPVKLAEEVLGRLQELNPTRYKRYRTFLSTFMRETQFLKGQELVDIPDSNHPSYPAHCDVRQLAIQREPQVSGGPRYLINADIWSQLDVQSQAGLILHEVIYREQILAGIDTSASVRFFNSAIWSDQMNSMDQAGYLEFFKNHLVDVDFEGYNFAICRPGRVDGELRPCARKEAPILKRDENEWLVRGFILPPWASWALNEKQYFEIVEPKTNAKKSFLTYGPYQKADNFLAFSLVESWTAGIGEPETSYAGYKIDFIANTWPDYERGLITFPRERECFELWSCEPRELDEKESELSDTPRNWAPLVLSRDKVLLNFYVQRIAVRPGYQITSCKGLVNLEEDGRLRVCHAYGFYQEPNVKLSFENSFLGFNKNNQLDFAHSLKNSQLFFGDKWITIKTISWARGEPRHIDHFSTDEDVRISVWGQNLKLSDRVNVYLNERGDVVRFHAQNPTKLKIAGQSLPVSYWYLWPDNEFYNPRKYPVGSAQIRLAASGEYKDPQGKTYRYQTKSVFVIDSKGAVIDCEDALGGTCQ